MITISEEELRQTIIKVLHNTDKPKLPAEIADEVLREINLRNDMNFAVFNIFFSQNKHKP